MVALPIAELTPHQRRQLSKVKVLKKLIDIKQFGDSVLNFIFVDIYYGRVRTQVTQEDLRFNFYKETIHKGEWKAIYDFQYVPAMPFMRLYQKSGMLYFMEDTTVEETFTDHDMDHWMYFQEFANVKDETCGTKYPVSNCDNIIYNKLDRNKHDDDDVDVEYLML
ncbi:unnamed protein product [Microthlaspi erraticum]|uniref:Replication protein A 70 kDa DNA-binding subunit B/D first OB fold domain-containing protein n=1 Tax=Microthlaspi erraticum TaxID=1685480 RepID=A0A6D2HFE0_9BRAS|nr:unnamed protein product [Microthlaspi erraticum]